MIRIIAKLFAFVVVLTTFLRVAPVWPADVAYVSSTGNDANSCTAAQPCGTIGGAFSSLPGLNGQIFCLNSPGYSETGAGFAASGMSLTIDCAGEIEVTQANFGGLDLFGPNEVVKIRKLTISGTGGGYPAIKIEGSGTLILENCVFENFAGTAFDIEPTGALNLVVKNSRVSNNAAAGVLIKPASGGSVTATFDGVTITNNAGGLRTDSTNGAVRVDITNSTISNNANNGLIALGGAGGQNMVSVRNDVIASNSQAGIEASGGNAAVLVNNTLLDSNTLGALSAVSSGRILTYQNNNIIGSPGTGFTGTASPQ
jgi:Right handed beta helix region